MIHNLFVFDLLKKRVDVTYVIAGALLLAGVIAWALLGTGGASPLWTRLLAGIYFAAVLQAVLLGLRASRLSATLVSLVSLALCADYSAAQLAEVSTFGLFAAATGTYFLLRFKVLAVLLGLGIGLLAAAEGRHGATMIVLFVALLLVRIGWLSIFERLSKKQWLLFVIKAVVAGALAVATYFTLRNHIDFPWAKELTWFPDIPLWAWLALGVVGLRGFMATLLIRTDRSPYKRAFRVFTILFSCGVIAVVLLLRHYGPDIFVPTLLAHFYTASLTVFSPEIMVVAIIAAGLMVSAGIDRSLYKDARFGHAVYHRLTAGL